ncbi:hypothetical protein [Actinoplanes siamensis]|uniref:Lipoprotein n=1 Tax=Actinoplanes siamensis TaxID=1223317 RepID=A0A919N443_9ACTN|nr:hypothetical protein [Actinoplanes siamensis]GIF04037.1 hypothetical protein Asi03nite_15750 [Actinoplanes siamensis]
MQPTPRRALRLTAALASAGVLAGCGALTTGTAAVAPDPTATPGPTSTFVQTPAAPSSAAPGLANTGSNLPVVVASLIRYGQWLIANPDPDKVANVAAPGCAAANDLLRQTRSLVAQGAYVTTRAPVVTGVRWPSPSAGTTPLGDQAVISIQVSRPAEALSLRSTGKQTQVISYLPALPATTAQISLLRGTDKKWRFCEVDMADSGVADSISALL